MECAGAGHGRSEMEWKVLHDDPHKAATPPAARVVAVPGPVIVGAGPSGLAVAACLQQRNVPSVVVEREGCLASLWQLKAYDRLRLHLPKQFCELPLLPFPPDLPAYPTKEQFVAYLERYAARFSIRPAFGSRVERAEYDEAAGRWRVRCVGPGAAATEYLTPWLVAATGENAEAVVPAIEGMGSFAGRILHTCEYRSGGEFRGKRVLVVGCGNSGMEVCLDLCNHAARPAIVVRDSVHVLPREMLGASTFGLSMRLLKWLPVAAVDRILLLLARLALGDTSRLGLHRPAVGPLRLKNVAGKTPVLDVGTLARIKTGHIQVFQGIKQLDKQSAEFVDGRRERFDAIILATGYKSNVPDWLKEGEMFSMEDGFPRKPFPDGWKGRRGLYAAGFTKRGLLGAAMDARRIADDIARSYNT